MVLGLIFLLGWPFEWPAIVLVFLPIFYPVVAALKFDLIWFGALVAVVLQTAFLSPPVAMSAYYLKQVVKDWSLATIYKGMFQFMLLQIRGDRADRCVPVDRDLVPEHTCTSKRDWRRRSRSRTASGWRTTARIRTPTSRRRRAGNATRSSRHPADGPESDRASLRGYLTESYRRAAGLRGALLHQQHRNRRKVNDAGGNRAEQHVGQGVHAPGSHHDQIAAVLGRIARDALGLLAHGHVQL